MAKKYGIANMMDLGNGATQTEQILDEEYMTYITAPLSPAGTDLIKFWEVSNYTTPNSLFYANVIVYS